MIDSIFDVIIRGLLLSLVVFCIVFTFVYLIVPPEKHTCEPKFFCIEDAEGEVIYCGQTEVCK